MNDPQHNSKVALVTGGAKRVGKAIALTLADAGYDIALTYHTSEQQAKEVVAAIESKGRRGLAVQADFARPEAADAVFERVTAGYDRVDALVNNASCFDPAPIGEITRDAFDHNMAVNAWAPLALIQRFAPLLGAHHAGGDPSTTGRIVNFIDIHVMGEPLKGYMAYNASKAALHEITMTAAIELAPKVTVNAIAPGVVAWADSYSEQMKADYMTRVPLARPGTPDDAAAAVKYLVCDAHYCTGQIIKLDGGRAKT